MTMGKINGACVPKRPINRHTTGIASHERRSVRRRRMLPAAHKNRLLHRGRQPHAPRADKPFSVDLGASCA